jgi:chlorite dismutase
MHPLGKKNKYIGFLFMKISQEYFDLGREGIHEISVKHAQAMAKHADKLTHVVTTGVDGRYDQVTLIEADTLEEINAATVDFRLGAKANYIEIVDVVVGMQAPRRLGRSAAEAATTEAG